MLPRLQGDASFKIPMTPENRCVLVVGAASQIGYHLLPCLADAGFDAAAVSRFPAPRDTRSARWYELNLAEPSGLVDSGLRPAAVIGLAPIRILPALVDTFAALGTARIVAFSSTSRFTKSGSADPAERELAATLKRSEETFARLCAERGIGWTVFRPTLVYSPGLDRNVSEIARFISRLGFFPILGEGRGRRQPVHAADLAAACVAALQVPRSVNRAYDLSGGETLTYREMVERIFRGLGRRPRIVRVPPGLFKAALSTARVLPRFRKLSAELVTRMNMDMCFDHADATRDLGFNPRTFEFSLGPTGGSAGEQYPEYAR